MNGQYSVRQGWNSELPLKNILLNNRNPMLAIALQYCSPAVALRPRWLLPRLLQGQRWYVPAWGWWFSKFCSACLFLSFSTALANQTELLSWYIGWWASDRKLDDHWWCLMWFVSCQGSASSRASRTEQSTLSQFSTDGPRLNFHHEPTWVWVAKHEESPDCPLQVWEVIALLQHLSV